MNKIHELKCWTDPYKAMYRGDKTHEFRKNDRDFQVGDYLHIRHWDHETEEYSGKFMWYQVTYVGTGFGIPEGFCCMSVRYVVAP